MIQQDKLEPNQRGVQQLEPNVGRTHICTLHQSLLLLTMNLPPRVEPYTHTPRVLLLGPFGRSNDNLISNNIQIILNLLQLREIYILKLGNVSSYHKWLNFKYDIKCNKLLFYNTYYSSTFTNLVIYKTNKNKTLHIPNNLLSKYIYNINYELKSTHESKYFSSID